MGKTEALAELLERATALGSNLDIEARDDARELLLRPKTFLQLNPTQMRQLISALFHDVVVPAISAVGTLLEDPQVIQKMAGRGDDPKIQRYDPDIQSADSRLYQPSELARCLRLPFLAAKVQPGWAEFCIGLWQKPEILKALGGKELEEFFKAAKEKKAYDYLDQLVMSPAIAAQFMYDGMYNFWREIAEDMLIHMNPTLKPTAIRALANPELRAVISQPHISGNARAIALIEKACSWNAPEEVTRAARETRQRIEQQPAPAVRESATPPPRYKEYDLSAMRSGRAPWQNGPFSPETRALAREAYRLAQGPQL